MLGETVEPLNSASWRKLASKVEQTLRNAQMLEVVANEERDDDNNEDNEGYHENCEDQTLVVIYVLMPNGNMITANLMLNATFFEIKEEVFELARKQPLFGALRDPNSYLFSYLDKDLIIVKEIENEEIRLCDASPFGGFLKLIEHKQDQEAKNFDEELGRLIGKSLKDFDALKNPEVNEFRYKMRSLCEDIVKVRQANSWLAKMRYAFPCTVDEHLEQPQSYLLKRMPKDGQLFVRVTFNNTQVTLDLAVNHTITNDDFIQQTVELLKTTNPKVYKQLLNECETESYYDASFERNEASLFDNYFLLKINGSLEYLLGNHRLYQYRSIQNLILTDQVIHLIVLQKSTIKFEDEDIYSVPSTIMAPVQRNRSQSIISLEALSHAIISVRRRPNILSSWSVDRKIIIRINSALRVGYSCDNDIQRVAIMCGIFHGGESLCQHHMTTPKPLPKNDQNETVTWDEDIVFNLKVSDLPRMSRLCFVIIGFSGNNKKQQNLLKSTTRLCWSNINFFDYRSILHEYSTTLSMWLNEDSEFEEMTSESESNMLKFFNSLGTVVQNPAQDECSQLTITFTKYSDGDNSMIRYPDIKEITKFFGKRTQDDFDVQKRTLSTTVTATITTSGILNKAQQNLPTFREEDEDGNVQNSQNNDDFKAPLFQPRSSSFSGPSGYSTPPQWASSRKVSLAIDQIDTTSFLPAKPKASKQFLGQIKEFCDQDLLYKMSDQECELLWFLREDCREKLPNALNKMLLSFKWNSQRMIGEALSLVSSWPKLPPGKALELLDYAYPDAVVRKYAIDCIRDISNEQLSHLLLQIVQALKYESYIYNDLVHFLLERAFENQQIGQQLFWLLRSEMHDPKVSVSFGLILEAYCRGAVDHIHILSKQVESLSKLKRINQIVRDDKSKETREKKIVQMQQILAQKFYFDTLSNGINPLNPAIRLGNLKVQKCRFMDSKMKPLWLVFENSDLTAGDTYLIFKNGDDLRQDMLTLQMIRIMDKLWKEDGLDLRMTPYLCISVAHNVGLIEVVLQADTIANIQKEKGSAALAAFKKGSIFAWLKDHNPTEDGFKKAIEEFTLSCAGYCVATYILGVADRHNDNIMIKKNGQLFHIDFGHILGKFKEKFGIRRERVPFVLTHDFVYVITHGGQKKTNDYFARFQQYCEDAFLIIRRRGNYIISLFAMMLSCGIPEISSVDDLQYLRETLVLDISEEQARTHFRAKFTEALKNSWKTSFNWCAHSLAKDNRMTE